MHFTEYHTRLTAYAVLVNDADEILLTWFNGGTDPANAGWSLPGGGVEYDEGIEDAVVREVHEETGFAVEVGPLLFLHHFTGPASWRAKRPYRSQRFVFRAEIVGGELEHRRGRRDHGLRTLGAAGRLPAERAHGGDRHSRGPSATQALARPEGLGHAGPGGRAAG